MRKNSLIKVLELRAQKGNRQKHTINLIRQLKRRGNPAFKRTINDIFDGKEITLDIRIRGALTFKETDGKLNNQIISTMNSLIDPKEYGARNITGNYDYSLFSLNRKPFKVSLVSSSRSSWRVS